MSPTHMSSTTGSPVTDEYAAARRPIDQVAGSHGDALLSLASMCLADRGEAERLVSELLQDSGQVPVTIDDADVRSYLSCRLYAMCTRVALGRGRQFERPIGHNDDRVGSEALTIGLDSLSEQERSAIALCLYGDLTYREAADLMTLPAPVVVGLLRSGLHALGR